MPRLRQSIKVIPATNRHTGQKRYIVIHKKTGFFDFWLEGRHYFYNLTATSPSMSALTTQIANYQNATGKKVILVKRKNRTHRSGKF